MEREYNSDLYFCALLDSLGAELGGINRTDPKRTRWNYSGNLIPVGVVSIGEDGKQEIKTGSVQDYNHLYALYRSHKIVAGVSEFANSIKKLKITLYD